MEKKTTTNKPKKKREYTTKQVIVPAVPFLKCAAQRNRTDRPVSLSLRFPGGGVSWEIKNREELLSLSRWDKVKEAYLIYLRKNHGILYIDIGRNGLLTVDKECLPGVRHMEALSNSEISLLWDYVMREQKSA